jgi:hypothetical protein
MLAALAHGVGGALEPAVVARCLFGSQDVDKSLGEVVEIVGIFDVGIERGRIILRYHKHAFDTGIDTIGDRNVDQAVFAANGYCWLGTLLGKREKAASGSASKDKGDHFYHGGCCFYAALIRDVVIQSAILKSALCSGVKITKLLFTGKFVYLQTYQKTIWQKIFFTKLFEKRLKQMDYTIKYQKLLAKYLHSIKANWSENYQEKVELVCDFEANHFLVVQFGWGDEGHIHHVPIHLNIRDGKIWIQENLTELEIDNHLMALGVPKSDIVLGVVPPEYRKFSGFAAA